MHPVSIIFKRELSAAFHSLSGYIVMVAFLGFTGFFTWFYGRDIFFVGQASLATFFNIAYWTLFFFIPALTMRSIAEEKKTGTIETMLTKPLRASDWIMGKFWALTALIAVTLACTLPYYATLAVIGDIDHRTVLCGYLGLMLMSGAYIGIGIFASSLTDNQIVAFLLTLLIGIFFHVLFQIFSYSLSGWWGGFFDALNMRTHYEAVVRGVVDSRDIIYFVSVALAGLLSAEAAISKR
ncbi:MAG: ABC transporter permease subunit [Bacteroidales bacterium]|nr:ABC transporter permease subunit [Bacteroidales bacterium]